MWNKDITRGLWWAVAAVLVYDGVNHALTGTAWGRVRGWGSRRRARGGPWWSSVSWRRRAVSTSSTASCSGVRADPGLHAAQPGLQSDDGRVLRQERTYQAVKAS